MGLVHGISSIKKIGEYRSSSRSDATWRLESSNFGKELDTGTKVTAKSLLWTADGGSSSRLRHNPITAADEKIALSVVHVNKKPQYLVFSAHTGHLVAKHWQLSVESSKQPGAVRIRGHHSAPISVQPEVYAPYSTLFQAYASPEMRTRRRNSAVLRRSCAIVEIRDGIGPSAIYIPYRLRCHLPAA